MSTGERTAILLLQMTVLLFAVIVVILANLR
jgi:hypothetical protein